MTYHPGEGTLQAYLDGEVPPKPREGLDLHLEACPDCQVVLAALDTMGRATHTVLADLDATMPAADRALWEIRRTRASRRAAAVRRRAAAAASFVLLIGAGWVAAMQGYPVRDWWAGRFGADPVGLIEPQLPATLEAQRAGMSQLPLDGRISISFNLVPAGSWLDVTLSDGARAAVSVPEGSSFETEPGRIQVRIEGAPVDLLVEIPEDAIVAEVLVNDRLFLRKSGSSVSYPGPDPIPTEGGSVRLPIGEGSP
jgi:hypothetical protein